MPSDRPRYRDVATPEVVVEHECPPSPPQRRWSPWHVAVVVLLLVVATLGWKNYQTDRRLAELEAYVAGAKQLRDEQNRALTEGIDRAVCSVLDRLPAGPLWDPVREEHGCGPGVDPASFDPGQVEALLDSYGLAALPQTADDLYALIPPPD